ncbi:hypothetical protein RND71_035194 [Anisodus tanguticus]|uniref:Retrotransposon protein, putative, Ty1-copia subclass n=1 Tax=Anisodus tanguticus TaxID=243964 RepID=A0AAE1R549_9SOLA|nr:hypothetical protein RND71_035194 [Anisodus tanguticus]
MTCKFQQNPGEEQWKAVKSILKYLRRTKDYLLVYGGEEKLADTGYTNASFQRDIDDYKSQSGYTFIFNGGAVSWKSSKQATTADSTTEAEYIAGSEADKNKHVPKKYHILREMVETEEIRLDYVPTDDNLADPFTKSLSLVKHNGHFENMGIRYVGDWL